MQQIRKRNYLIMSAFVFGLTFASSTVFSGYDGALPGADVEALFKGNTLEGKHSVQGFPVDLYVNPDGTAIEKRNSKIYPGKWHVDSEGRFCWVLDKQGEKWQGELWCRWVVKTGENEFIKLKDDGTEVRRFKVTQGKAF